jgi:TonB family protein
MIFESHGCKMTCLEYWALTVMSRSLFSHGCLGFLILFSAPFCYGADEDGLASMHRGVSAKPIERLAPRYPRSELGRGRQGWVQLSYVVTADGDIVDPVVENSSGSQAFEKEALRTVHRWSYEPATWDGAPVQQCHTKVMITFALEGAGTGVTRKFYSRYKKIEKTIDSGELSNAQEMIDDIVENLNLSLSETAWLWALRARLAGLVGDKDAQLFALRKATENDGRWVDDGLYPNLLLVRTALEIENGNFSEALSSYDKLVKTKYEHPQLEKIEPYVDTLREIVASEKALSVPARIGKEADCVDCATNWHYHPLRRKFTLAEVSGNLRNIEFRCSWQRVVDKAREDAIWEIPEDWGDCSIIVFGEPGTTFNLLELPRT